MSLPSISPLRFGVLSSPQPVPEGPAVHTKLAYQPPGLGLIGKLVEAPEQGRSLGSEQERGQGRHDLVDQSKGSLARADRGEILEGRREDCAEGIELGADERVAQGVIGGCPPRPNFPPPRTPGGRRR